MEVNATFDLIVVGAGPAGSSAAIVAARRGMKVLLLEAGRFPRHKVCGEFVSSEAVDVLHYVVPDRIESLLAVPRIARARIHSHGRFVEMPVSPAAYSIPRITLDEELWNAAQRCGVTCRFETVREVKPSNLTFSVETTHAEYDATSVINASGRWSRLSRRIPSNDSWIGLKAHFAAETDDAVDLYFTGGGYCGIQAVSPGVLNACALVRQGTAKTLQDVLQSDEHLANRSRDWRPLTEVFATAPVHLGPGSPISDGMLQVGDAAGFVDPFIGDGISLALRSGVLAGRCVGEVPADQYARIYQAAFSGIFRSTGQVRRLMRMARPLRPALLQLFRAPGVAGQIFSRTRHSQIDVLQAPIG